MASKLQIQGDELVLLRLTNSNIKSFSADVRFSTQGIFGVYQGGSNHEEFHNLMKATLMIRRLKKDVLSELLVKHRQQED